MQTSPCPEEVITTAAVFLGLEGAARKLWALAPGTGAAGTQACGSGHVPSVLSLCGRKSQPQSRPQRSEKSVSGPQKYKG